MLKIIVLGILSLVISSCIEKKVILDFPIEHKKYNGDLVSVHASINIALQSYVAGCVQNKIILKTIYDQCVKKGRKHIEDNVIFILDQSGVSN